MIESRLNQDACSIEDAILPKLTQVYDGTARSANVFNREYNVPVDIYDIIPPVTFKGGPIPNKTVRESIIETFKEGDGNFLLKAGSTGDVPIKKAESKGTDKQRRPKNTFRRGKKASKIRGSDSASSEDDEESEEKESVESNYDDEEDDKEIVYTIDQFAFLKDELHYDDEDAKGKIYRVDDIVQGDFGKGYEEIGVYR